jgi:hypothetical protein
MPMVVLLHNGERSRTTTEVFMKSASDSHTNNEPSVRRFDQHTPTM